MVVNTTSGAIIQSPKYPNSYENNIRVCWSLELRNVNRIQWIFEYFETESTHDALRLYASSDDSGVPIAMYGQKWYHLATSYFLATLEALQICMEMHLLINPTAEFSRLCLQLIIRPFTKDSGFRLSIVSLEIFFDRAAMLVDPM